MKVVLMFPVSLALHNSGKVRVNKQYTDAAGGVVWETIMQEVAVNGGQYEVELGPGRYQKVLVKADGLIEYCSLFEITADRFYHGDGGTLMYIKSTGELTTHRLSYYRRKAKRA